jgi:hypothetical protein
MTNLDSFYVFIDSDFRQYRKIFKNDSLQLPVGPRKITVVSEFSSDFELVVEIFAGKTTVHRLTVGKTRERNFLLSRSSYPRISWGANLLIYTDEDSDILINGKWVGRGAVKIDTVAGSYNIVARHEFAGSTSRTVFVRANRLALLEMYNKPQKGVSRGLSLMPGFSQFYQGKKVKGAMFFGLTLTGVILANKFQNSFEENNFDYENLVRTYQGVDNETDALRVGDQLQKSYDDSRRNARLRDTFLIAAAVVYLGNFIDAWVKGPKSGYREIKPFNPNRNLVLLRNDNMLGIRFAIHF